MRKFGIKLNFVTNKNATTLLSYFVRFGFKIVGQNLEKPKDYPNTAVAVVRMETVTTTISGTMEMKWEVSS